VPRIRLNTQHAREVAQRLYAEADALERMTNALHHATDSLDTWAWDGCSRARVESHLNRVVPTGRDAAQALEDLGRKLRHVADTFEQEDATASRSLEGMAWVEWGTGSVSENLDGDHAPEIHFTAPRDQNTGPLGDHQSSWWSPELTGSAGNSTSHDFSEHDWETKREAEVKLKLIEGALYDAKDGAGDVKVGGIDIGGYRTDAKAGMYEAGAKVGLDKDGFTAGAYGEVSAGEGTAEGVIGGSALGLAGVIGASGPSAEAFVGIKDNTLGASIGGSIVSAEAEAGLNIAGANVGVKVGASLGLEFGFKIGKETEVKFGPFKAGLAFGKAKG